MVKTLWDYYIAEDGSAATTTSGNIAATMGTTCERTSKKSNASIYNRGKKNWSKKKEIKQ